MVSNGLDPTDALLLILAWGIGEHERSDEIPMISSHLLIFHFTRIYIADSWWNKTEISFHNYDLANNLNFANLCKSVDI